MIATTVHDLVEQLQNRLELECKAGEGGSQRAIRSDASENKQVAALVGHLNLIHPSRIQVLGTTEIAYLDKLGKNSRQDAIQQLYENGITTVVIIADGATTPRDLLQASDQLHIPLYTTFSSGQEVINHLQYLLGNVLADTIVIHGVFMEVMGSGILLTGDSGIGKSELALDLISRGHRLIADDAPQFSRIAPDIINGTCPAVLREFLEVRGLGVLNICSLFGDSAVKPSKYLRLIISLENMTDEQLHQMDRLRGSRRQRNILGVKIPEITLPVTPGRNLAIAVETAIRTHILLQKGYDAAEDFIQRQTRLLQKNIE